MSDKPRIADAKSQNEREALAELASLLRETPIPENEVLANLPLFMRRQELSRVLFLADIYAKILNSSGVILEFGSRWGANLALFSSLRGMLEPFNHSRTIVGFDTFEGFAGVGEQDGGQWKSGDYGVSTGYQATLERLLALHEGFSPIPHVRKFELIKGDVTQTAKAWVEGNPHALVALAYFDMDLFAPTKAAFEAIKPRLHKGSVIVFDEINCREFPGETQALIESLDIGDVRVRRHQHQPFAAWIEF